MSRGRGCLFFLLPDLHRIWVWPDNKKKGICGPLLPNHSPGICAHSLVTLQGISLSGPEASVPLPEACGRQLLLSHHLHSSRSSAFFFPTPQSLNTHPQGDRAAPRSLHSTHPSSQHPSSLLSYFCDFSCCSSFVTGVRPSGGLQLADEVNHSSWDPFILLFLIPTPLQITQWHNRLCMY